MKCRVSGDDRTRHFTSFHTGISPEVKVSVEAFFASFPMSLMASRWAPLLRNNRIEASSFHAVIVQK